MNDFSTDTTYYVRDPNGEYLSALGEGYTCNLIPDAQEFNSREDAQAAADEINKDIENEDLHFEVVAI